METYPIIIGTAGHIDHGKTALVRELTGIDTDRLKVEKERGITTELGFAHLDLSGQRFGVVDVPGHERFIKAMVAGAGGLDLVCLVIAADEGVMPQTREHLDICQLLGVRRGLVALSKSDLVDADWLDLVSAEISEYLVGSFLEEAPIIPVSVISKTGLDQLKSGLLTAARDLPARNAEGSFRLPIDRVFSMKGFGTVVTGTVISGSVAVGDEVEVQPSGPSTKIRGIEVHGAAVPRARAGMRAAINLARIGTDEAPRGHVLTKPGEIAPSHLIDARFRYLKSSKQPLKRLNRILVHHGTIQRSAVLALIDQDTLQPGEEALVQLRLDATTPLSALPGDRFIARGFTVQEHYGTTLGGGEIIRVLAAKARRKSDEVVETIHNVAEAAGNERLVIEVRAAKFAGLAQSDLVQRLGVSPAQLNAMVQDAIRAGDVVRAGEGASAVYCHVEPLARLEKMAADVITAHGKEHPEKRGIPTAELRERLPPKAHPRIVDQALEALLRRGTVELDRDVVRVPSETRISPFERKVENAFLEWGNTPERPKDVAASLGADRGEASRAMEKLLTASRLIKIKSDLYLHRDHVDSLRQRLTAHLDEGGQITPAEWKEITGTSRKFSIPLAEYFDGEKLTLRVGDVRKRRKQ